MWAAAGTALSALGVGLVGLTVDGGSIPGFTVFVVLLAGFGVLDGIVRPVRQAYLNENIPSAQRATVLSFDSFFADIGAVGGQLGLGYAAQAVSKAVAYTIGGAAYFLAVPLYRAAGAAGARMRGAADGPSRDAEDARQTNRSG